MHEVWKLVSILYLIFSVFTFLPLTSDSIKTYQVKTCGKILTQHFYCFKSSKVPISLSTITVPGIRKGFRRTFIIKIFMRQGPISGYNWQRWLQWPGSITFDVRQYLVILPQPQSSLMSGQSFAKKVEFSAARCIFVLFFSRSDIREARGHQLDTAQTPRHDTITVTIIWLLIGQFVTIKACHWSVSRWSEADGGVNTTNTDIIIICQPSNDCNPWDIETCSVILVTLDDAYCATLRVNYVQHSFGNWFQILHRISGQIPQSFTDSLGAQHSNSVCQKLLIKQNMFVLKRKNLTGHLDPALENLQQMKEKLCKL